MVASLGPALRDALRAARSSGIPPGDPRVIEVVRGLVVAFADAPAPGAGGAPRPRRRRSCRWCGPVLVVAVVAWVVLMAAIFMAGGAP